MEKQNILIVHNFYQIHGGEDTVVANEKKLLEEHGHTVWLYSRNNNEIANLSVFRKILLPVTTIFSIRTYREIKRLIKKKHIDIVHVHNTLALISPAVFYAAVSMNVPVIQTLHNFRMLCPNGLFYRDGYICEDCLKKGLWCSVKHGCYRGSRLQTLVSAAGLKIHRSTGIYGKIYFICLTEFNREKLLELNKVTGKELIKTDMVFIKPNFTFDASDLSGGGKYYLFAGRLEKIKGIHILLNAFSQMPEMELHIAGSGKETYQNQYEKCLNIKFLGFLSERQLEEEYINAKALVVASQVYEGFPMNLVEAYAHGVPVIVGDIGNAASLVKESYTGIHYQYNNSDSLVNAVKKFEKMNYKKMRAHAIKEYQDNYMADTNYLILKTIYANLKVRPAMKSQV